MSTKENIIEAFWKLYAEKPIEKITIQELMNKAGYHRSVFYVYFKDIYDLLEQEEKNLISTLEQILPEVLSVIVNNSAASVEYISDDIYKHFEKNFFKVDILLRNHGDLSFLFKIKKLFKKILQDLVYFPDNDYKANLSMEFFINGHLNALLYLYKHYNKVKLEDYLKMVIPVFNSLFK